MADFVRLPIDTALILIDLQEAIDDPSWGPRNNPQAEEAIASLLSAWREAGMPAFHVRHASAEQGSPYRSDAPGQAFKAAVRPLSHEPVVTKSTRSAFVATDLDALLTQAGITTLVVCGVLTHNSVEATVRHAADLGYRVIVAADACWSVDIVDRTGRLWPAEDVHRLSLAVLDGEYAKVSETAAILTGIALQRSRKRPWRGPATTSSA